MDIQREPNVYAPAFINNEYVDDINIEYCNGVTCPCGSRSGIIFYKKQSLKTHCQSQYHKKWLEKINGEKQNYYSKTIEQEKTIKNQQKQLTQFQNEVLVLKNYIQLLESKVKYGQTSVVDNLIDLDL